MAAQDMAAGGALDVLFLLGADEIEVAPGAFVIYIGTHGDRGAHRADVILPGAAYTEKTGLTVNTEGRVQLSTAPASRPGMRAKTGRSCARCPISSGTRLPYNSLAQLRATLFKAHPQLARLDVVVPATPRFAPTGRTSAVRRIGGRSDRRSRTTT